MARGWRLFDIAPGVVGGVVRLDHVINWWRPAAPDHKRLPTVKSLEMYVRMVL